MKNTLTLIILLWASFGLAQNEIFKPAGATYFVAYDSINGVYHTGITQPNQVTTSGQPTLKAAVNELEYLKEIEGMPIQFDTLPPEGELVSKGIYSYDGTFVICRQEHIRTTFTPEETPALFAVYRPENDGSFLEWVPNELVYVGQIRTYNGVDYECIQQHQTLPGQTPDITPALWNEYTNEPCPGWVQPTGAQDAYGLGDCVTHNGFTWTSTTPANVWEPGVFGWTQN